jgi:uncharacterized protein (TIGR00369 family)
MPDEEPLAGSVDSGGPSGPLMEKMGLEWLELTAERVVGRIPVEGNQQPFGVLHGGASAALAETIASVGAWLTDPSKLALGVEISVHHLRRISSGWVTGIGVALRTGRGLQLWEVRITDDDGRLCAFATCTLALRDPD